MDEVGADAAVSYFQDGRETEEAAEEAAGNCVGHVPNVPGLSGIDLPTRQMPPSWHVGNVPRDFFGGEPGCCWALSCLDNGPERDCPRPFGPLQCGELRARITRMVRDLVGRRRAPVSV